MLTPEEDKRLESLREQRQRAETKLSALSEAATAAVKARNAQFKVTKEISAKWLELAERKFGL